MKNLRTIRKARGKTIRTCAAELGVVDSTWVRWESLETDPTREQRDAIADFLGVTLDQLAGRPGAEPVVPVAAAS